MLHFFAGVLNTSLILSVMLLSYSYQEIMHRGFVISYAYCLLLFLVFNRSGVAWQFTLNRPVVKKEGVHDKDSSVVNPNDGDLYVLLFRSLISSDKPVISNPFKFITSLLIFLYVLLISFYDLCRK